MKRWKPHGKTIVVIIVLATVLLWASGRGNAQTASQPTTPQPEPVEASWPRRAAANGHVVLMYQPQINGWENHARIAFRAVIVVLPSGHQEYLYGVLDW
jgi:hypothetical protein